LLEIGSHYVAQAGFKVTVRLPVSQVLGLQASITMPGYNFFFLEPSALLGRAALPGALWEVKATQVSSGGHFTSGDQGWGEARNALRVQNLRSMTIKMEPVPRYTLGTILASSAALLKYPA
jgi:hypothetical protein